MESALNDALSHAPRRGVNLSKNGRDRVSTVAGTGAGEPSGGNPQSQQYVCMAGRGRGETGWRVSLEARYGRLPDPDGVTA